MRLCCLGLLLALGCAGAPPLPAPGTGLAWGEVRLVPREGVTPGSPGSSSYGDRRLRDVEFVDYSRPGFAVIYLETDAPPTGELELAIRSTRIDTRIEPSRAAVGAAGHLFVRNETESAHALSYPAAGMVRRLDPGERTELPVAGAGEQDLFLLDTPGASATVFASPGPFTVVTSTGRFALRDLPPGRRRLHAWHPRFPPAVRLVELVPDGRVRVDFEIGVGRSGDPDAQ